MVSVQSIYLSKLEQFQNVVAANAAKCAGADLAFADILDSIEEKIDTTQTDEAAQTEYYTDSLETLLEYSTLPQTGDKNEIEEAITCAALSTGFDEDLIRAVIQTESSFRTDAVSGAGAQGLMQLMPPTAEELGVDNPFDAYENVMGGSAYLAKQYKRFGDIRLALAAYNTGPHKIASLNITDADNAAEYEKISPRVRRYVDKVLSYYEQYS